MMKSRLPTRIIFAAFGVLISLSGLVFMLQGIGVVGPSSSVMYRNSQWIYDGVGILALGLVMVAVAIVKLRG